MSQHSPQETSLPSLHKNIQSKIRHTPYVTVKQHMYCIIFTLVGTGWPKGPLGTRAAPGFLLKRARRSCTLISAGSFSGSRPPTITVTSEDQTVSSSDTLNVPGQRNVHRLYMN